MFLNQQFSVLPYPKNALNEPYVLGTMFYDENSTELRVGK
jgi:hypothetical protein